MINWTQVLGVLRFSVNTEKPKNLKTLKSGLHTFFNRGDKPRGSEGYFQIKVNKSQHNLIMLISASLRRFDEKDAPLVLLWLNNKANILEDTFDYRISIRDGFVHCKTTYEGTSFIEWCEDECIFKLKIAK